MISARMQRVVLRFDKPMKMQDFAYLIVLGRYFEKISEYRNKIQSQRRLKLYYRLPRLSRRLPTHDERLSYLNSETRKSVQNWMWHNLLTIRERHNHHLDP